MLWESMAATPTHPAPGARTWATCIPVRAPPGERRAGSLSGERAGAQGGGEPQKAQPQCRGGRRRPARQAEDGGVGRELGQPGGRSPAGGRAGSGRLAVTAGRAGVGRKVGRREREEATKTKLRRRAHSQQRVAVRPRAPLTYTQRRPAPAHAHSGPHAAARPHARAPARPRLRPPPEAPPPASAVGGLGRSPGPSCFKKHAPCFCESVRSAEIRRVCPTAFPAAGNFGRNQKVYSPHRHTKPAENAPDRPHPRALLLHGMQCGHLSMDPALAEGVRPPPIPKPQFSPLGD